MKIVTRDCLIQKLEKDINCKIVSSLFNPGRLEITIKKKFGYHRYLLDGINLYSDSTDHILNKKMKDNIELLKQIRDWQLSKEERDYVILNTNLSELEIFTLYGISYATQRAVRKRNGLKPIKYEYITQSKRITITNKTTGEQVEYKSQTKAAEAIGRNSSYLSCMIRRGIFENDEYTWSK